MISDKVDRLAERENLAEKSGLINHPYFDAANSHWKSLMISTGGLITSGLVFIGACTDGNYAAAGVGVLGMVASEALDLYSTRRFNKLGDDLDNKFGEQ